MKVYIGKFGPCSLYYLLEPIFNILCIHMSDRFYITNKLSDTRLGKFINKKLGTWNQFKYIKIDHYDVWNVDNTLSLIALPLFKRLKMDKNGSGSIEDKDVPEALRSYNAPPKENEWDTDEFFHDRYDWVLNEIIWAFEQMQPECDWESQFWRTSPKIKSGKTLKIVNGNCDWEGLNKYNIRIDNGLRLFGKYYRTFWT